MHWLRGSFAILGLAVAGCDGLGGRQPEAAGASTMASAPAGQVEDLRTFEGRPYAEFVAAHQARFSADALGLSAPDAARLQSAMSASLGAMQQGGGAEALVFRGCAASGCGDGAGVVAVDAATGASFVGVRDAGGKDVLAPNDRLEALLRLNTPSRDWIDVSPLQAPIGASSGGAERP